MSIFLDYLLYKIIPWVRALVVSTATGCLVALGAVKINSKEVFNFTSDWNTELTLKLAAWGAFLGLLQHLMKSPLPTIKKKRSNRLP
jgi:hypothetical protein